MQRTYLEKVLDNALLLEGTTTSSSCTTRSRRRCSASCASASAARCSDTTWIWRCHIDLTDANPEVWEFFRPFVELHDASVWTMPEFVPGSLDMAHVRVTRRRASTRSR